MKKKIIWIAAAAVVIALLAAFLIYAETYYHAEPAAEEALQTNESVSVTKTDYGWFFDGPSEDNLLVFYPGAKVEETAYAPILRSLAGQGMDACLVKMPFRFAFFGMNRADDILPLYAHQNRYIGGHSLGGAMAANYAAKHSEKLNGVILLAAYPMKQLDDRLRLISIYGSEDGVLNMEKVQEGRAYAPHAYTEYVIEGGNHAQFGYYGTQKGDGTPFISRDEQQERTVEHIVRGIR